MRRTHLITILVLPAVFLAVLLTLAATAAPAHASGIVSVCDEAHLLAAVAGGGTVTFSCSGTITLTAEIVIVADTTIDGSGQTVTISGNHADAVRVFRVDSGATLNLHVLTIADGSAGVGGSIFNNGTLTVSDSTFSGNRAGFGGGIYSEGVLTVSNSTFTSNSADSFGGGICSRGTLTVSRSTFSGNNASGGGGILSWAGTMSVSSGTFSDNSANSGGGILSWGGTVTVSNSTFAKNSAQYGGGGIVNDENGTMNVSNSAFSGNRARSGGGIYNQYGTVNVSNSTFSGNTTDQLGGGIINHGTLTVSNSTCSSNGATEGGGVYCWSGTVIISNSTFAGNSANDAGGGIDNWRSTVTLRNTIVASSPTGYNCSGSIIDGGGNLSYPDPTCPGIHSDPKLGPLQDNGGPTWTMALLPGSAALDAADDAICAATPVSNLDQRGVTRPQGPHCDIGAFEAILPPRTFLPIIWR